MPWTRRVNATDAIFLGRLLTPIPSGVPAMEPEDIRAATKDLIGVTDVRSILAGGAIALSMTPSGDVLIAS